MREKLGILLMEDQNGEVAVQLFADPTSARAAFENLAGRIGDPPQKATFITLNYTDVSAVQVVADVKMLPVVVPIEDQPDGYVLGKGPVFLK